MLSSINRSTSREKLGAHGFLPVKNNPSVTDGVIRLPSARKTKQWPVKGAYDAQAVAAARDAPYRTTASAIDDGRECLRLAPLVWLKTFQAEGSSDFPRRPRSSGGARNVA